MTTPATFPRDVRLLLAGLAAWTGAYTVHMALSGGIAGAGVFSDEVAFAALIALVGLCYRRALKLGGRERWAWLLLATAVLMWSLGYAYRSFVLPAAESMPMPAEHSMSTPTPADVLAVLFYPFAFGGLFALLRTRVRTGRMPRLLWLDATIAGLAIAAIAASVSFESVAGELAKGSILGATLAACPMGDLALVGLVVGALALSGWRRDTGLQLLGLGLFVFWLADSHYAVDMMRPSAWNVGFWLAVLLVGVAAWQPGLAARRPVLVEGMRVIFLPLAFALLGVGVLVTATLHRLNALAVGLAAAALICVLARLLVTWYQHTDVLRAIRKDALTDGLTGLGNRRLLALDLDRMLEAPGADPVTLALFDLDGFKHYNDTFGHPAGDSLLTRLGASLRAALGARGRAYRMGGDEFCALIEVGAEGREEALDAAALALTEHGEGFSVGCSWGAIVLRDEATDSETALRRVDQRMYAQKRSRRGSPERQSKDVLLVALAERNPELGGHLRDVGELAEETGRKLGLDDIQCEEIRHAAELRDVGKMAVPDAILNKPGPLDESEWEFVRRHPIVGERIVAAAPALQPVAALVRSSHERFDGAGYPDGLVGEQIPLGSRIVAVCDAFDAMVTERPYRPSRECGEALTELCRCAGTQFDPVVVDAFCEAWARLGDPAMPSQGADEERAAAVRR